MLAFSQLLFLSFKAVCLLFDQLLTLAISLGMAWEARFRWKKIIIIIIISERLQDVAHRFTAANKPISVIQTLCLGLNNRNFSGSAWLIFSFLFFKFLVRCHLDILASPGWEAGVGRSHQTKQSFLQKTCQQWEDRDIPRLITHLGFFFSSHQPSLLAIPISQGCGPVPPSRETKRWWDVLSFFTVCFPLQKPIKNNKRSTEMEKTPKYLCPSSIVARDCGSVFIEQLETWCKG